MELQSLYCYYFFFFFFILFPLSLFLFFFLFHQTQSTNPQTPPLLKPYPLLGTLPHLLKNRHRLLDWTTDLLLRSPTRTLVFFSSGNLSGLITAHPANLEHVFKANFQNYPKGPRAISLMEDFLGHGIFNSDGDSWQRHRNAAALEFNNRSFRKLITDTVRLEISGRLLPLLRGAAGSGGTVDLQQVLERFAFDNICSIAFGEDPGCLSTDRESAFMAAFEDAQKVSVDRFTDVIPFAWRVKKWLDVGSERRLRRSISVVRAFATKIIRSRRERPMNGAGDLLSRFSSSDENTEEEVLRDNIINFILAGRETTSSALTWFFWILSTRSEVEQRILAEIRSIREAKYNHEFGFDELREMHYLHAAISESMRLYPPVPINSVSCHEDDMLPDGTSVGKGWFVGYSGYAMGRMEEIWGKDCNDYKPERWLTEDGVFQPESPYRYPIFHAGPRVCLGKEMAYIQMKSIAASVLERFEIDPVVKGTTPEHVLSMTLRMKGGLLIRVREREGGLGV